MLGYVFLAPPMILLLAARRIVVRRGRQDIDLALGFVCSAFGVIIWPTQNALVVDRALRVPGLAHLLTDTLILLSFALLFRFVSKLRQPQLRFRHALFVGAIVLIGSHAALWVLDEVTVPGDHAYLFYNHYYGRPLQLFLTYLVLGTSIMYTAGLYLWSGVPSVVRPYPLRVRVMGVSSMVIAAGTVVYGALVIVQVIASALGFGSSAVTRLTVPIMSSLVALSLVSISILLFRRRFWQYIQDLIAVKRQRELMRQETERQLRVYERLVHLSSWLNERLLRVRQDYSAADAVEAVTSACARLNVPLERRRTAREAVRIITLSFENVLETPFFDDDERQGTAEHFILQIGDGTFFYDHVFKVAALAVGADCLPADIEMPGGIEEWHRELAHIVASALRQS